MYIQGGPKQPGLSARPVLGRGPINTMSVKSNSRLVSASTAHRTGENRKIEASISHQFQLISNCIRNNPRVYTRHMGRRRTGLGTPRRLVSVYMISVGDVLYTLVNVYIHILCVYIYVERVCICIYTYIHVYIYIYSNIALHMFHIFCNLLLYSVNTS